MSQGQRPLSPHLQIYRFPITAVLSILHRATGVALAFGAVGFAYWLIAASYGPEPFASVQHVLASWFGRLLLFGFTFAFWYHMGNGIRHLIWDTGRGLALDQLRRSACLVIGFPVVMTVITFLIYYYV